MRMLHYWDKTLCDNGYDYVMERYANVYLRIQIIEQWLREKCSNPLVVLPLYEEKCHCNHGPVKWNTVK